MRRTLVLLLAVTNPFAWAIAAMALVLGVILVGVAFTAWLVSCFLDEFRDPACLKMAQKNEVLPPRETSEVTFAPLGEHQQMTFDDLGEHKQLTSAEPKNDVLAPTVITKHPIEHSQNHSKGAKKKPKTAKKSKSTTKVTSSPPKKTRRKSLNGKTLESPTRPRLFVSGASE